MKLYFVFGADTKDDFFNSYQDLEKLEIRDLMIAADRINPSDEVNKIDVLIERLMAVRCDCLIGQPIGTRKDYRELKEKLIGTDIQITKFFIKPVDYYSEYKVKYNQYSNWMDYHPDYVKEQDVKQNKELEILVKELEADGVEVEFIAPRYRE